MGRGGEASSNVHKFGVDSTEKDTINQLATKNYEADGGVGGGGVRVDHVGFGVVQGKDKKRFKTRSGETV